MVHRGSYLWQYHGAKMVRPKTGGEKNITGSQISARGAVAVSELVKYEKLNLNLPNLKLENLQLVNCVFPRLCLQISPRQWI